MTVELFCGIVIGGLVTFVLLLSIMLVLQSRHIDHLEKMNEELHSDLNRVSGELTTVKRWGVIRPGDRQF